VTQTLDAVFKDDSFKPLDNCSLPFAEGQRVKLTVETPAETQDDLIELAAQDYDGLTEEEVDEVERRAIDSALKQTKLETVEVYGTGGTVAEVGKYSVLGGNGEALDSGKYIVLWKREKGKWKLYRDIWNSNMPAR
jgi:ketosteroid isomerase-like protein